MKNLLNPGSILAAVSLALFTSGALLFFDVLWPWIQLRHDGEIAVDAWVAGGLLSVLALCTCRQARGLHWTLLGLCLLTLLGLGIVMWLGKPSRLI